MQLSPSQHGQESETSPSSQRPKQQSQSNPGHLPQKLPSHTEIHTSSPIAAGLPILEIVKNLEDEKIINREDRAILKDALYSTDPVRREEMIKALCDVELSSHSRFAIRRLKSVIHQNGSGEVSSKHVSGHPLSNKPIPSSLNQQFQQVDVSNVKQKHLHQLPDTNGPHHHPGYIPSGMQLQQSHQQQPHPSNNQQQDLLTSSPHHATNNSKHAGNMVRASFPTADSPALFQPQKNMVQYSQSEQSTPLTTSHRPNPQFHSPVNPQNQQQQQMLAIVPVSARAVLTSSVPSAVNPAGQQSMLKDGGVGYQNNHNNSNHMSNGYSNIPISNNNSSSHPNQQNPVSANRRSLKDENSPTDKRYAQQQPLQQQAHQLKNPNKNNNNNEKDEDDEEDSDEFNVQSTVSQVVGTAPMYAGGGDTFNVLFKIIQRLSDITQKIDPLKLAQRKFAVLVGSGSYNPLTRMHLRTYFLAKQYLETHLGYIVLGSLLSPAHPVTVRERYRTNSAQEIIPAPHRLAIAQLLVQNSKWVSIDPWEMTRRRPMDYLSLLEHVQSILSHTLYAASFQTNHSPTYIPEVKVLYLCKANLIPKLSPQALKQSTIPGGGNGMTGSNASSSLPSSRGFACVSVCRTAESDALRANLTAKWNGLIHVVEDNAILDASFDMVTSRKVRDKIKAGESVETLVGAKIQEYCLQHRLGPKMNGEEEWTAEERQLPKIASRPAEPTLIRGLSQQWSQSPYPTPSSSSSSIVSGFNNHNNNTNNTNNNKFAPVYNTKLKNTTKSQYNISNSSTSANNNNNNNPSYAPSWSVLPDNNKPT